MQIENDSRPHNPKLLRDELFSACKWWLSGSVILKFMIFAVGATSIWFSVIPNEAPYVVGVLMVGAELAMWKSDRLRCSAEALHRKLDFENSFGWQITPAEISDILARSPCDLERLSSDKETGSNFFASEEKPGPERAAANLQESAWWSKHLAESMWMVCLGIMVALVALSITLLVISLNTIRNALVLENVGRVVTSVILLIFSLGLFRFMLGFFQFSKTSEKIEEAAKGLASHPPVEETTILKLWQDYHLARASAPILPTWVWKRRERKLNELWTTYRA
jgi:hypothetical protein